MLDHIICLFKSFFLPHSVLMKIILGWLREICHGSAPDEGYPFFTEVNWERSI